ncbi:MAG: Lrp/AsnC family transcriptional regulator [Bacteroidales bacterium]|jgi:DNA-binding Lrp family transcriptional regulator
MKKPKVDAKDILILNMLAKNARLPNKEIAAQLKLSEPSTLTRENNLISREIIKEFKTNLNYEKMNYNHKAAAIIHYLHQDEQELYTRIKNTRLVTTATLFKSGEQLKTNWLLLIVSAKTKYQADATLEKLFTGMDIFYFEVFQEISSIKCDELYLDPLDVVK